MPKKIRLFWWNERKIQNKAKENYGDMLGKYLVEKISGKKVEFAWPQKNSYKNLFSPIYVTIGSVLAHVSEKCIVWGSGIINKTHPVKEATFLAVRGPQTRKYLIEKGYQVPEVYGDPAILLPDFYTPEIPKAYTLGIIPHYNDYKAAKKLLEGVRCIIVIDFMTNDVEKTTCEILACERIVSSSLHGLIVSHAYGIPAVWQKFSDKVFGDDIKYQDYMESVQIPFYKPAIRQTPYTFSELEMLFTNYPSLPNAQIMKNLKEGLIEVCPFEK
ncbi:polysaccharide pyruvyl transferase family protein [Zunongwangia sp. HGR-M22]|uniref:polysaccharide pyruvyl transferase family protein n=1 Tax=Zunongwangia sp. HGR-M22 TaxID=3015168 RepID=UPI0022DE80A0|nr:polysaccharide pyruvyl transferase family protein [Zunongwangia sp. HGR-M22]WBL24858.1 polysaccharide pyruvyl transferase family protein [Zunongwangia sp. HGR-M22]